MTTLIKYSDSSGEQHRCDARCYNAIHPDCVCICGGTNHGAGLQQAILNTREQAAKWIEEYEKENGETEVIINEFVFQLALI